jgi:hypothetical protein
MRESYRVEFCRRLVNSYGRPFPVNLASFQVGVSGGEEQAVGLAIERFEREFDVARWHHRAHDVIVNRAP